MEKIEQQLKHISSIEMTQTEKNIMRGELVRFMAANPIKIQSPYMSIVSKIQHKLLSPYGNGTYMPLFAKGAIALLLVAVLSIGSLTFASESALPGDLLYPIKINIREHIEGSTKTSPEAKLAWQEVRIERRLKEIKTLKVEKKLTKETVTIAKTVFQNHVSDFQATAKTLKDDGKNDVVIATTTKLLPAVEAYATEDTTTDTTSPKETSGADTVVTGTNTSSTQSATVDTPDANTTSTSEAPQTGVEMKALLKTTAVTNDETSTDSKIDTSTLLKKDTEDAQKTDAPKVDTSAHDKDQALLSKTIESVINTEIKKIQDTIKESSDTIKSTDSTTIKGDGTPDESTDTTKDTKKEDGTLVDPKSTTDTQSQSKKDSPKTGTEDVLKKTSAPIIKIESTLTPLKKTLGN